MEREGERWWEVLVEGEGLVKGWRAGCACWKRDSRWARRREMARTSAERAYGDLRKVNAFETLKQMAQEGRKRQTRDHRRRTNRSRLVCAEYMPNMAVACEERRYDPAALALLALASPTKAMIARSRTLDLPVALDLPPLTFTTR